MKWFVSACGLIILDLITKWFAKIHLMQSVEIIPGFLKFSLSFNPGVAFSIPIPNIVMIFLTPLLVAVLIGLILKTCNMTHHVTKICVILIAGGAAGNFINRIWTGSVIDFISFSFWPSFNFADIYLTIGAMLLIFFYGRIKITSNH